MAFVVHYQALLALLCSVGINQPKNIPIAAQAITSVKKCVPLNILVAPMPTAKAYDPTITGIFQRERGNSAENVRLKNVAGRKAKAAVPDGKLL